MSYGFLTPDFSTVYEVTHMERTVALTPSKEHTHFLSHSQFKVMGESSDLT